jgi:ABC-2 type transport system ATP-binding protein
MAQSPPFMVQAEGLEKRFGDTHALRGLDLAVPQGSILGVLGPNGAGKTTAVRILTTLSRPDGGRAEVAGFDVVKHPAEVRRRIGVTGQYAAVDELLTGAENLEMIGRLSRMSKTDAKARGAELLEQLSLTDAANRIVKGYSGGMRRRLDLAASLMAMPPMIFLDEPTTGLDPRSRIQMWDLIGNLVANGTTLLLTTQYLEEADRLADEIAVIDEGHVIARGTSSELKARVGGERLEIAVSAGSELAPAARVLEAIGNGPVQLDQDSRRLSVPVSTGNGLITQAVLALDDAGVQVDDIGIHRPTLDDVFLQLTGHGIEDRDETLATESDTHDDRRAA